MAGLQRASRPGLPEQTAATRLPASQRRCKSCSVFSRPHPRSKNAPAPLQTPLQKRSTKFVPRGFCHCCFAGILLRRLLSDPTLSGTSHVVLDEVHERSIESDLLLLLLRNLLASGGPPLSCCFGSTAENK
jgi:hypothetical protein